jgi:hypothetical protein
VEGAVASSCDVHRRCYYRLTSWGRGIITKPQPKQPKRELPEPLDEAWDFYHDRITAARAALKSAKTTDVSNIDPIPFTCSPTMRWMKGLSQAELLAEADRRRTATVGAK